jgi:REP element-mobilizing transposase RayT
MPHSLTDLVVHVIFSTKGRCPLLDDALKPRLFAYVKAIVQAHGGRLHNINGAEDHLHLLLSLPTTMALADLMRLVKGRSSHWIRQEFSVSRSRLSRVYEYIARQPDHHKKVTFREEFLAFLRKHEISYDEKFLKI